MRHSWLTKFGVLCLNRLEYTTKTYAAHRMRRNPEMKRSPYLVSPIPFRHGPDSHVAGLRVRCRDAHSLPPHLSRRRRGHQRRQRRVFFEHVQHFQRLAPPPLFPESLHPRSVNYVALPTFFFFFLPNLRSNRQLEPPLPFNFSCRIFRKSALAPNFPFEP